MEDEMSGIKDRIDRIRTINDLIQPSQWDQWKQNPEEAIRRLESFIEPCRRSTVLKNRT